MLAICTVLIFAAWWLLAVAMPPCPPPRARRLRLAAGCALALSLGGFIAAIGVEQGPVFWTAALMLGALAVALVRAIAVHTAAPHPRRGRARR